MKVKHPEKYNGKLTAAMRAAILAGAVAVTGGCAVDKNPVMGDIPAPEPISTNDSPEEFITIGEIPSEIEGALPIEPVEGETLPQDVVFSEEMLTPRMVAIPAYNEVPLSILLEKVANVAVVEQPKGEDEKEIIIVRTMGVLVPTMPPSPVPSTTKEDSAAEEDAKAREELAGLVQTLAEERAKSEEAEPKD